MFLCVTCLRLPIACDDGGENIAFERAYDGESE